MKAAARKVAFWSRPFRAIGLALLTTLAVAPPAVVGAKPPPRFSVIWPMSPGNTYAGDAAVLGAIGKCDAIHYSELQKLPLTNPLRQQAKAHTELAKTAEAIAIKSCLEALGFSGVEALIVPDEKP